MVVEVGNVLHHVKGGRGNCVGGENVREEYVRGEKCPPQWGPRLQKHLVGLYFEPVNVTGSNDFGSFCEKQNLVLEANLAFMFSRGHLSPLFPACGGP